VVNSGRVVKGLKNRIFRVLVFLVPFCLVMFGFYVKLFHADVFAVVVAEDGMFEQIQAGLYLLSSAAFILAAVRFFRLGEKPAASIFLVLSLGLALIFAEEISWGQRIFNLETSEYFSRNNTQGELTIHNLSMIQPFLHLSYILISLAGIGGWLLVKIAGIDSWKIYAPSWYLSSWFVPAFVIYFCLELSFHMGAGGGGDLVSGPGRFFAWRDQELAELMLSAGFFLFSISALRHASGWLKIPYGKQAGGFPVARQCRQTIQD